MTVDPKVLALGAGLVVAAIIIALVLAAAASAAPNGKEVASAEPATSSCPPCESEVRCEQEQGMTPHSASSRAQPPCPRLVSLAEWLYRNGWTFDGREYHGWFHTAVGAWRGCVQHRDGEFLVLIHEAPPWLLTGSHADCMYDRGDRWFWIHLNHSLRGVRETICGTEAFLLVKAQEEGVLP